MSLEMVIVIPCLGESGYWVARFKSKSFAKEGTQNHGISNLKRPLPVVLKTHHTCWNIPQGILFSLFSSVQLLSRDRLFMTPRTAACQAFLSITNSRSLLKLMSIESVRRSNHIIHCHPLLLSSIFPNIRVFSNESILPIRWPKYWSFSFSISPSNEYSQLISFRID